MSNLRYVAAGVSMALLLLGGSLVALASPRSQVGPPGLSSQETAFTYQGYLSDGATPANGAFDLVFSLHDDPDDGSQIGPTISESVVIDDGLFTVELDFGSVFGPNALWLEIGVRRSGSGDPYNTLRPRQRLTAAPFASYAFSTSWSGIADVPAGFDDDVDDDELGRLNCSSGQIPEWSGTAWTCGEDNVGTGSGGDITAVGAGYGLGGGGTTGDIALYVITDAIQTRVSGVCPTGWAIRAIQADGSVDCELAESAAYSAGTGLSLSGTTFAISSTYQLPQSCADGQLPKWSQSVQQFQCQDDLDTDTDTDTTYQAGTGLSLSGTTFAISTTYQLPQSCGTNQIAQWSGSGWSCADDQVGSGAGWSLSGNAGTTAGTNFLGTTDGEPLELRVNGNRALRLEPDPTSPNILGGYGGNAIGTGVYGATVGGGGRDLATNQVSVSFGTIGGGAGNSSGGYAATVSGGEGNSAGGHYATVSGGQSNDAGGESSFVGGGDGNVISSTHGTIAGGIQNTAGGTAAAVSGGAENAALADYATAGGGWNNLVAASFGTVGGGGPSDPYNPKSTNNRVYDDYGTVSGGGGNIVGKNDGNPGGQSYATVAGGESNSAAAQFTSIGGGSSNRADAYGASVGGGSSNQATGQYAIVGGGSGNQASGQYAIVGGGSSNTASGSRSVVAGGQGHSATGSYSAIGGGSSNVVSAAMGTIGGGHGNTVTGTYGTIPGGWQNAVGASYAFAAGHQAHAQHEGSFVWSDSTATFASTGPDQFLISATGGVGIGTDSPSHVLTVGGSAAIQDSVPITVGTIFSNGQMLQAPSAVFGAGDLLYVTSYATNTLTIWNVVDPTAQALVGATTSNLSGPGDVQVIGDRAYVASYLNNRLVVLDVSDPSAPDSLGSTDENLTKPMAVHVSGKYAYVASAGHLGTPGTYDGLAIFDIADPTSIAPASFVTTSLQGTSDVFVSGSYAYVTSTDNDRLVVFDVSDPRPGRVIPMGYSSTLAGPVKVHVSGSYAYVVARDAGAVSVFDVSDPAAPVTVDQITTGLTNPRSIYVAGDRAYVAYAGDAATSLYCGLAVLDVSDPANVAILSTIDMSDWLMWIHSGTVEEPIWTQVPPKPVAVTGDGNRIYLANEEHDSVTIFEVNYLEAPAVQVGEMQAGHLDITGDSVVRSGLDIHGGLSVGPSGALIAGALSVAGADDSHILGGLSVGGAGAAVSDTVGLTSTLWITAPTHTLDVVGEARVRVNDHHNLVLRSPNSGGDEDGYIDFIRSDQTEVISPSARIEFDAADPLTHTTSIRFHTQGPDDATMIGRLEISEGGHLLPAATNVYVLGDAGSRWLKVYTRDGVDQVSDARYKDNVATLAYGLGEVSKLRPVRFTWREGSDRNEHYGFVAQEVREVLPELVTTSAGREGTLSMNYDELLPVLVSAMQEQQEQIDSQAEQIAALEARLSVLERSQVDRSGHRDPMAAFAPFGFGGLLLGSLFLHRVKRMGGRQ